MDIFLCLVVCQRLIVAKANDTFFYWVFTLQFTEVQISSIITHSATQGHRGQRPWAAP